MRIKFAKTMFRQFFTRLLLFCGLSHHAYGASCWEGSFTLRDGSEVCHTASGWVILDQLASRTIHIEASLYNDMILTTPILLKNSDTRSRFITALIDTGLYTPTQDQVCDYFRKAQWTHKYDLGTFYIIHTPKGVCRMSKACDNQNTNHQFKQVLCINNILLRRHFSKTEFDEEIQMLRKSLGLPQETMPAETMLEGIGKEDYKFNDRPYFLDDSPTDAQQEPGFILNALGEDVPVSMPAKESEKGNWTKSYDLGDVIITHEPSGIYCLDKRTSPTTWSVYEILKINGYYFFQEMTQDEFRHNIYSLFYTLKS